MALNPFGCRPRRCLVRSCHLVELLDISPVAGSTAGHGNLLLRLSWPLLRSEGRRRCRDGIVHVFDQLPLLLDVWLAPLAAVVAKRGGHGLSRLLLRRRSIPRRRNLAEFASGGAWRWRGHLVLGVQIVNVAPMSDKFDLSRRFRTARICQVQLLDVQPVAFDFPHGA